MARPIAGFTIDLQQERALHHAAKAPGTPQRVAQRCRVLLARSKGLSQLEAGRSAGLARNKVGSWERCFADLTAQVVRESSFGRVKELASAIETDLAKRNLTPKPYRWRAQAADILAKIQRARTAQA